MRKAIFTYTVGTFLQGHRRPRGVLLPPHPKDKQALDGVDYARSLWVGAGDGVTASLCVFHMLGLVVVASHRERTSIPVSWRRGRVLGEVCVSSRGHFLERVLLLSPNLSLPSRLPCRG